MHPSSRDDFSVDLVTSLEIRLAQKELRAMRTQRMQANLETLRAACVPYTTSGRGHCVIKCRDGSVFDFWSGTGKWRRRYDFGGVILPLANGRGVDELLKAIEKRK